MTISSLPQKSRSTWLYILVKTMPVKLTTWIKLRELIKDSQSSLLRSESISVWKLKTRIASKSFWMPASSGATSRTFLALSQPNRPQCQLQGSLSALNRRLCPKLQLILWLWMTDLGRQLWLKMLVEAKSVQAPFKWFDLLLLIKRLLKSLSYMWVRHIHRSGQECSKKSKLIGSHSSQRLTCWPDRTIPMHNWIISLLSLSKICRSLAMEKLSLDLMKPKSTFIRNDLRFRSFIIWSTRRKLAKVICSKDNKHMIKSLKSSNPSQVKISRKVSSNLRMSTRKDYRKLRVAMIRFLELRSKLNILLMTTELIGEILVKWTCEADF